MSEEKDEAVNVIELKIVRMGELLGMYDRTLKMAGDSGRAAMAVFAGEHIIPEVNPKIIKANLAQLLESSREVLVGMDDAMDTMPIDVFASHLAAKAQRVLCLAAAAQIAVQTDRLEQAKAIMEDYVDQVLTATAPPEEDRH